MSSDVHNVHSQVRYLINCESVVSQDKANVYILLEFIIEHIFHL